MSDSIESLFSNSGDSNFTLKGDVETQYPECISMAKKLLNLDVSSMTDDGEAIDVISQAVKECYQCIGQGIESIKNVFVEGHTNGCEIVQPYLSDLVSLLQLLIQFLRSALDLLSAQYQHLPDLPQKLSLVMIMVFSHCRDSESMYGDQISVVGDLLKDLFKTCHELQVLCFVIMDKHFVFDVSDENKFSIFTEVLDLSVDIGEIVLDLDIKTMAEQWKGYVVLCEKYAQDLMDNYTFDRCITLFCRTISDNVASLLLDGSDQKLIMRSMKVSGFLMKMLIKLCQVFSQSVLRNYSALLQLLMTLMGLPESYLLASGKSEQLIQKLNSHLGVAALPLLAQLMTNHNFAMDYFNFNLCNDNDSLGYLMLTTNIMKTMLERDIQCLYNVWLTDETNVLCNIFKQLSKCHTAFASGLSLECRSNKSTPSPRCGVYEYVLLHTGALAATLERDGFVRLEETLIKSVLQEESWQSIFATDLWCVLARFSPPELCFDQVTFLIELYITNIDQLENTPLKVNLASTIHRLFNLLPDGSKCQLLDQFPVQQREHRQVWSAIELSSLPDSKYEQVWRYCVQELNCVWEKVKSKGCSKENVYEVIHLINVVSTGAIQDSHTSEVCNMIAEFWRVMAVFKEIPQDHCKMDASDVTRLVEFGLSVVCFTVAMLRSLTISNAQLLVILDIILTVIKNTPTSLKIGIISILNILSHYEIPDDAQTEVLCKKIATLFEILLTDEDKIVCSHTFIVFHTFSHHTNKDVIVSETVAKNINLKEDLMHFIQNGHILKYKSDLCIEEQLKIVQDFKFVHKCAPVQILQDFVSVRSQTSEKSNVDFDIGDIDMLFDEEMDESCMTKTKCDNGEGKIYEIINRLDSDLCMLEGICCNTRLSLDNKAKLNKILMKVEVLIE